MKEQILKLRAEGKTYREIVLELGCSRSTVAYHCGEGQKAKNRERVKCLRKENPLLHRASRLRNQLKHFKRDMPEYGLAGNFTENFTAKDVKAKFEQAPFCYLSGRPLSLERPEEIELDHIVPRARGGTNDFSNLGFSCRYANRAKSDLSVEELLVLCKDILEHNGFVVAKKG